MTGPVYPTDDEIHAYVDDALEPARRDEVAGILRNDAALDARIRAYAADRDALRLALVGIMRQPVPPAWQASIMSATRSRNQLTRRMAVGAGIAAAVAASVGGALLWPAHDPILQDALAARDQGLASAEALDGADPAAQAGKLAAALRLSVRPPDLMHFGFRLAALAVSRAPAAQIEYRDGSGRRLTIYVRPSDGTVRFDLLRHGKARVCVWQDDVVGAVIIADMSAGEMMRVAGAAYAALNL